MFQSKTPAWHLAECGKSAKLWQRPWRNLLPVGLGSELHLKKTLQLLQNEAMRQMDFRL